MGHIASADAPTPKKSHLAYASIWGAHGWLGVQPILSLASLMNWVSRWIKALAIFSKAKITGFREIASP
jgi:hypothetical protein